MEFPIGSPLCAISHHSVAISHRMSPTHKSIGPSLWGKIWGKKLTDVSQILTRYRRHGSVECKRNCFSIFCRLGTMHERDRQTNRQQNVNISRIRRNCLSVMSPNNNNDKNNTINQFWCTETKLITTNTLPNCNGRMLWNASRHEWMSEYRPVSSVSRPVASSWCPGTWCPDSASTAGMSHAPPQCPAVLSTHRSAIATSQHSPLFYRQKNPGLSRSHMKRFPEPVRSQPANV